MTTKLSFLARSVILLWMLVVGSVVHIDAKTVYYVNDKDWTSVQIHFWGGSNESTWGALPSMSETGETVNSHKIYSYDIGDNTKCIFKNGETDEQTTDLTPPSDKALYYNGWKEYHESRDIYLKASAIDYWAELGAIQKATFKPSGTVVTGTLVDDRDNAYKFVMPAGWDDTVSFGRYDPSDPDNTPWSTTADISIPADKNYVTTFVNGSSYAEWDVYSPPTREDYYLVVNNTRRAGEAGVENVRYKFQPVLIREMENPIHSTILYTLTLPDFVLTGEQGRAENPNCFTATLDGQPTMYYTIQNGDGTVIYQPLSSTTYGNTYYAGNNETGHTYVYVWNHQEPNKEHYISINGGARVKMTKGDNMKINGHGPIWYYDLYDDFGADVPSTTNFTVTLDYSPGTIINNWGLYDHTKSSFASVRMVDGTWDPTLSLAPAEDPITKTGKNYELGYESGKFTENSNGNLTNVQMESYGANINKNKTDADADGYNFFLKKDKLAKSYTWYLNIGNSAYAPSDRYPRFTSNAQSVAIAANQLVEGHTKNAIVEQNNASGVQDYYLTGNLKMGAGAMTWQPVENKMKMTRIFFKDGKSTAVAPDAVATNENCDSIVYVLQMVRPEAGWGNMFLSMAGERNLDAYKNGIATSDVTAWWATLIRPQVFTNKDAQWNFGGLEVNGSLNHDGTYTKSYGNTSQAINPILDNTVTGYTAYFNMTNATYRLVYYKESASNDEGLFIIGPAVGGTGDETYHAANGRKVKLNFNPETGAYEAENVSLTEGKGFRFANIKQTTTVKTEGTYVTDTEMKSAYESYYDEDEILPARDGEPGDADWLAAQTWETDYFNRLSKLKNADDVQEITDGTPVTFKLPDGTYNVRFYTKYLGENDETVTNAYYTIDYHIGVGNASEGTDISAGAGSTFTYHKTWSSRLAYLNDENDPLDVYYVKDWTWNTDPETKIAKATVTFSHKDHPAYIAPDVPVVLVGNAASTNKSKTYVIVPGDPYGVQQAIQDCKPNVHNIVRCVYETEDYTEKGFKAEKYTTEWNTWSTAVGPGNYDNNNNKYITRNFIFGRIVPTWRNDGQKELNFWRMKSTNYKMTGHKFLVVADVPNDTKDLESGATFSSYESGAKAQSMANYMTFCLDDEELATDIQNVESKEVVVENSRIYNLMGIEVKTPIRGQVYIINGRKTIKK